MRVGFALRVTAWLAMMSPLGGFTWADRPAIPNVVIIIADDHHWSDYGFMGHPHLHTPRLDRLASESLVFRCGYVPSSLCCPSLASLITGLYPHQHLITCNDPPVTAGRRSEDGRKQFEAGREQMNQHLDRIPTLPKLLTSRGYESLQTGKWWQGDYKRGGFTTGMTTGERHGDVGLAIGRETMQPIDRFLEERVADRTPFFVWYAPMMPHQPHHPAEKWTARYTERADSPHVARYWGMIEWFDETCGQLLDLLDKRGFADNTIIVYLADNGWIQDPKADRYAPRSKQSPYDGGIRTPIMIRWPGKVSPRVEETPVTSIDIAPTILDALGTPRSPAMPGINLLDARAVRERTAIFGECFTHTAVDLDDPAKNLRWRWIVSDGWKLIAPSREESIKGAETELYRVGVDAMEKTDLAKNEPERVQSLQAKLDGWWNPESP